MHIELRSDTFTKPTEAMLAAMQAAPVGDDVFGEDPTVNELQHYAAQLFGMEAALFCPSGTMTNQIAIKCHTQPADEVICDVNSHVYQYEGGGIAFNSGASVHLIQGHNGCVSAQQITAAVNNRNDPHKAYSQLVSLENTNNKAGGTCYNIETLESIKAVCKQHQLNLHLDGARLFNAMEHTQTTAAQYGQIFDSISICLSKGLGAPVGSLLLGSTALMAKAKRVRKLMGGGMRQAGYIAAAGLYALKNHLPLLATDHAHALQVAEVLATKSFVGSIQPVQTNIIIFEVHQSYTPNALVQKLAQENIHCIAMSATQVRFVFHYDVSANMVNRLINVLKNV